MCFSVSNNYDEEEFFQTDLNKCLYFRDDPKQVEVLIPPQDAVAGERVVIENFESGSPDEVLNPKKKVWEKLQIDLKTNSECIAQWQGNNLVTKSGGTIRSSTMKGAPIK